MKMTNFLSEQKILSPVFLAPLAGITDLPFRDLVNSFGAGLVVSEIVASKELIVGGKNALARASIGAHVENTSVQISGSDPLVMAECARMCEDHGAKIIDINMGCPAKKVVNGYAGSALMQDIKAAKEIIEHVVNAVKVPVTLKTRLGWDDKKLNAPELCVIAQDLGTQLITLHGRTRCQFFKGTADWDRISDTVNALQIPVIANGDITDVSSARRALKLSGAAGIMIGRGVGGKPWLLAEISHVLFNTKPPKIPNAQSFCEMMVLHYEAALTFYGDTLGVRSVRKHINWYLGYMGITDGKIRKKILTEENPSLAINMIKSLIDLER
jgi:tRNA-dihydrouridine synthase B